MSIHEAFSRAVHDAAPIKMVLANIHNGLYLAVAPYLQVKGWAEAMVPISICFMNLGIFLFYISKIFKKSK